MNKKKALLLMVFGTLMICIIAFIWYLDIPNWAKLDISKIKNVELSTNIYDRYDNKAASVSGTINREYISLNSMPVYVPHAFIAAEDARFYSHNGIDLIRILGAVLANIKSMSYAQGASTITQQLIKTTHLSSEKTLARKIQETYLALQLEKVLTKDEILEAYVNTVYFGGGAYGIGAASYRYFSKHPSELSVAEAALLAGIIKSPTNYAPHNDPEAAKKRRDYVLHAMENAGYIDKNELQKYLDTPIILNETANADTTYGWFVDYASSETCRILNIDREELYAGGYSVYTTLDTQMQTIAENITENDTIYPEVAAQGAMIAASPDSGAIRALTGGREYTHLGLNRAVSAYRQPGSLIKPLSTYAAAVEKYNYLPTSAVYDVQRSYSSGYTPGNAGNSYYGKTTLRFALSKSLNAASVDLADTIGIYSAADYAKKFGLEICDEDINLSLSLGCMKNGVTPLKMCAAYSTLANGGTYNELYCIRKITDRQGRVIYEHTENPQQAVSSETAYIITDMLVTAANEGTASALKDVDLNIAAKTGTAGLSNSDTSDAWATAYTPEIAVTVWIGKDSNSDGGMARNVSGSGYAVPACKAFLEGVRPMLANESFTMPESLTRVLIDEYALISEGRVMLASATTPAAYISAELFDDMASFPVSDIWNAPQPVTFAVMANKYGDIPVIQFTGTNDHAEYIILRKTENTSDIAGVVDCKNGETVSFMDTNADITKKNSYTIIPRHALLYDMGITLTGPETEPISNDRGILTDLSSLILPEDENSKIETVADPLF